MLSTEIIIYLPAGNGFLVFYCLISTLSLWPYWSLSPDRSNDIREVWFIRIWLCSAYSGDLFICHALQVLCNLQYLKTLMGGSLWFKVVIKYVCLLSLHNTYGLLYHSHKVFYDCLEQTDSPIQPGFLMVMDSYLLRLQFWGTFLFLLCF